MTQSIAPTPTPTTTRCKDSAVDIAFLRACVKPCNRCKESNVTNTGLHTFQNIKNADVALGIRTAQHIHASVTRFILELAAKTARCRLPMTARASKAYWSRAAFHWHLGWCSRCGSDCGSHWSKVLNERLVYCLHHWLRKFIRCLDSSKGYAPVQKLPSQTTNGLGNEKILCNSSLERTGSRPLRRQPHSRHVDQ